MGHIACKHDKYSDMQVDSERQRWNYGKRKVNIKRFITFSDREVETHQSIIKPLEQK